MAKIDLTKPLQEIPKIQQRQAKKPLSFYFGHNPKTGSYEMNFLKRCVRQAYKSGWYSLSEIGNYIGKSRSTISRWVLAGEDL